MNRFGKRSQLSEMNENLKNRLGSRITNEGLQQNKLNDDKSLKSLLEAWRQQRFQTNFQYES